MRAGEPDAMDRMVGSALRNCVQLFLQRGETARMVTLTDGVDRHLAQRSTWWTSAGSTIP